MKKWIVRLAVTIATVCVGLPLVVVLAYAFLSKTNGELVSSGETRRYLLHVPSAYDPAIPVALVISLHGAWLSPGSQKRISGWNELADREGFIVVYPQAKGFPRTWEGLDSDAGLARETRFFDDLIDTLSAELNLDPAKVFINGFSNGAAMTFRLSCSMADRVAAFGMVALPVSPWENCQAASPASAILFQGTADTFIPFEGGENWMTQAPLPAFQDWFAGWGDRNQCQQHAVASRPAEDVRMQEYGNCSHGTSAHLYVLEGAGHVWPGGVRFPGPVVGPYTDSVNATERMWDFFRAHPLPVEFQ